MSSSSDGVARTSGIGALAPLILILLSVGCASLPPTLVNQQPRRGITPRSNKMKIAVFNFIDQTGSAGKLVETLPDMLSTELFGTKRFEVTERAQLRSVDPQQTKDINQTYKRLLDVLLVGSITRFSVEDKTMTIDVRVYNAVNGTVMFAGHFDVHYSGVLDVKAERKDISKMAEAIYSAFPVLGDVNVRVAGVSGGMVTVNLGEKDGVKLGMGALVVAGGDTLTDPVTKEELTDAVYVGEIYVVEVDPKTSKAIVDAPQQHMPVIKLNDLVRFK